MMLVPRRNRFGLSLFDDVLNDSFFGNGRNRDLMRTDIREKDGSYLLEVDLPGFAKADIKIEYKDGYLTINASKNQEKENKDEDGNYIHQERYFSETSRSFYFGKDIHESDIKATFAEGVLSLTIPKTDESQIQENKYIAID